MSKARQVSHKERGVQLFQGGGKWHRSPSAHVQFTPPKGRALHEIWFHYQNTLRVKSTLLALHPNCSIHTSQPPMLLFFHLNPLFRPVFTTPLHSREPQYIGRNCARLGYIAGSLGWLMSKLRLDNGRVLCTRQLSPGQSIGHTRPL